MSAVDPDHVARRLLEMEPGVALCDSCLAFACSTSLDSMRAMTETLVRSTDMFTRLATCASCRRAVTSTVYAHGPVYARETAKCAQCSQPFDAGDVGVVVQGERLHAHCLQALLTDETIRASRTLSRQSRELIEQSRRRLLRTSGMTPPPDAG